MATGIDRFCRSDSRGGGDRRRNKRLASELDKPLPGMDVLRRAKKAGLSDKRIAGLTRMPESRVRQLRESYNIKPVFKTVDTCAGEFGVKPLITIPVTISWTKHIKKKTTVPGSLWWCWEAGL